MVMGLGEADEPPLLPSLLEHSTKTFSCKDDGSLHSESFSGARESSHENLSLISQASFAQSLCQTPLHILIFPFYSITIC